MELYQQLVNRAVAIRLASTPLEKMKAHYDLLEFLEEHNHLDVYVSVQLSLADLEQDFPEEDKDAMRSRGYAFPEDLDDVKKLFHIGEE